MARPVAVQRREDAVLLRQRPEGQFYHCFSSGKHGDIFRFLMETEGLPFPEAVERLAAEAGVALPAPTRRGRRREEERAGPASTCMELAAAVLRGAAARPRRAPRRAATSTGRGLDAETSRPRSASATRRPSATRCATTSPARASTATLMVEAGLLIARRGRSRSPYDRFRDRVMFPIADARGRVIAFGGRAHGARTRRPSI